MELWVLTFEVFEYYDPNKRPYELEWVVGVYSSLEVAKEAARSLSTGDAIEWKDHDDSGGFCCEGKAHGNTWYKGDVLDIAWIEPYELDAVEVQTEAVPA